MFLPKSTMDKIEACYIGKRVQRPVTITPTTSDTEHPLPDVPPQTGRVIGVMFNNSDDKQQPEAGVALSQAGGVNPFRLIVELTNGAAEVWGSWTRVPDRYNPSEPTLIEDVLTDTISTQRFCALVGCSETEAAALFASFESRRADVQS